GGNAGEQRSVLVLEGPLIPSSRQSLMNPVWLVGPPAGVMPSPCGSPQSVALFMSGSLHEMLKVDLPSNAPMIELLFAAVGLVSAGMQPFPGSWSKICHCRLALAPRPVTVTMSPGLMLHCTDTSVLLPAVPFHAFRSITW